MEYDQRKLAGMPNNRIAPKGPHEVLARGALMLDKITDQIIKQVAGEPLTAISFGIEDVMMLKLFVYEVQRIVDLFDKHVTKQEQASADDNKEAKETLEAMLSSMGIPAPKCAREEIKQERNDGKC